MRKNLFALVLVAFLAGCVSGPCYQAMKFRVAAEHAQGLDKAALLGKADGLQKECDAQSAAQQEAQKLNARGKSMN
jgi:hypothetical protein